eukprot:XP_011670197.1 PREDICTED: uncharacterized protein LOC105441084 [Strongylocentrotus purpuratus]
MNSPNNCITACEERGFAFAATVSGMECSCSCPNGEQGCLGRSLEDSRCGFPCVADRDSFCGGYMTISLYKVNSSGSPNVVCKNKISDQDANQDEGSIATSSEAPSNPLVLIVVPISVVVAIVMISVVAGVLVRRRLRHPAEEPVTTVKITKKDSETSDKERYRMNIKDKHVQDRDSRVATGTQYQPLNAMPKLPDIPQADVTTTASPGTEVSDGLYEDPDHRECSVPTADIVLAHEYLVSGQEAPSRSRSSDEYHEYNYPEIIQSKLKDPVSASIEGDDGYMIAEPGIQDSPNPGSKVYYSSRLPISQSKGDTETSPTHKSKVYYSSRIPVSAHKGRSGSSS